MSVRANAPIFQSYTSATPKSIDAVGAVRPGDVPLQQHQSPSRQILAKTNPSGVPIVSVPNTRLSMEKEGEIQPLDNPVGRRREYKGDGGERQ